MQKVTQFLEKNVEWLALALGVGFMLFMVWTYVISDIASMPLGTSGIRVTPANVDDTISENGAKDLHTAVTTPTYVHYDSTDYTASLQDSLNLTALKVYPMASAWDFEPIKLGATGNGPANQPVAAADAVQKLPDVPPAVPLLVASGQSTILDASNSRKDVNWAAVLFTVPAADLQDAWKKSFGPDPKTPNAAWKLSGQDADTVFLTATLFRSYKLPNGQWSPDTEVARLWNNQLSAYPKAGDGTAEDAYALDIATKQSDVISPKFPDLAPAPSGTNFLTSDKLIQQAIANKAAAAAAPGAAPAAQPAPAPGQPAPAPGAAPSAQPAPAPGQPAASPDPDIEPKIIPNAVAPAAITQAFNPGDSAAADYLITLFDTNLKPGVTYRYRISYKLKNPLFHLAPGRAAQPDMVKDFELLAKLGDYSAEIKIESKTHFYCASPVARNDRSMKFDVYTQSAGQDLHNVFNALPGDPIGGVKDSVDYSTGYTYVDSESNNNQVLVTYMDDDGTVMVKDAGKDITQDKTDHPPAAAAAAPAADAQPAPAPAPPPLPLIAPPADNRQQQ